VKGCPVGVEIPVFINYKANDFSAAINKSRTLQPNQLYADVSVHRKNNAKNVNIGKRRPRFFGRLERLLPILSCERGIQVPQFPQVTAKNVAVVGAGPAG
jgi:NADPH-dependent glutamate synthase beta subunit-like oxidoreductase